MDYEVQEPTSQRRQHRRPVPPDLASPETTSQPPPREGSSRKDRPRPIPPVPPPLESQESHPSTSPLAEEVTPSFESEELFHQLSTLIKTKGYHMRSGSVPNNKEALTGIGEIPFGDIAVVFLNKAYRQVEELTAYYDNRDLERIIDLYGVRVAGVDIVLKASVVLGQGSSNKDVASYPERTGEALENLRQSTPKLPIDLLGQIHVHPSSLSSMFWGAFSGGGGFTRDPANTLEAYGDAPSLVINSFHNDPGADRQKSQPRSFLGGVTTYADNRLLIGFYKFNHYPPGGKSVTISGNTLPGQIERARGIYILDLEATAISYQDLTDRLHPAIPEIIYEGVIPS